MDRWKVILIRVLVLAAVVWAVWVAFQPNYTWI
jgi:hypothetical protein